MKRLWPLLLMPILVVWLALPRDFPVTSEVWLASALADGGSSAASLVTGAPHERPGVAITGNDPTAPPTPRPSGGIGEPASYCKPQFCETPQPRIVDGISGEATWWYSFGPGIYTALRPDLGSKGDLVIVCGPLGLTNRELAESRPATASSVGDEARGQHFHCRTAPVITSCACLGPNSERLVDLSRDLFAEFADPSLGVVRIVIQVVER